MEMSCIYLPSRQVGVLLRSVLTEKEGNFEAEFDENLTTVTLSSVNLQILHQAELEVKYHIGEIERNTTNSTSYFLHCAYIPLLYKEKVVDDIQNLEVILNVRIRFTDQYLLPIAVARIIASLGDPVLGTLQLKDITVPVGMNDTRQNTAAYSTNISPIWYYSSDTTISTPLSTTDTSLLEIFFQFGGNCITLSGEECVVDFNEKKLRSKSGQIGNLQRVPPFVDVPEQNISVHIWGHDYNIKKSHNKLLELLNASLVTTAPIPWSIEPQFLSNTQQQIKNFARQFCVSLDFSTVEQVSSLSLTGAPGYVEAVHEQIKQQVTALVEDISKHKCTLSPGSFQISCPPLWVPQTENCVFCDVPPNTYEWNEVYARMNATLPGVLLQKLERIQNIILWEKYSLEMKHMAERNKGIINEKYLFHGTGRVDPHAVASSDSGIDFRYSKTSERSLMWGSGAYFALELRYSNMYSYRLRGREARQVILVSVLTGHSYPYGKLAHPELKKPPVKCSQSKPDVGSRPHVVGSRLYDTVNGETGGSVVYVVYDHSKSCPAYIITYTAPK